MGIVYLKFSSLKPRARKYLAAIVYRLFQLSNVQHSNQAEKKALRELQDEIYNKSGALDMETISRLVEGAASKGFRGKAIDDAKKIVSRHATQRQAHAYLRYAAERKT